ncbi:MAG: hypothetical protein KF760_28025 [Candidatus Eremiobacteraeota bacterium]|nr:hypothetical protein [Candidatus Eremiobacteraeota bacterium]MCW5871492.1 hypothetical protein [Candidatus Eremiobacteraeota bacterium]
MKKSKGIALFLVLGSTGVLAVMLGAFVTVNQSNFSTMGASFRQREALHAAETGVRFCQYKLEHDKTWAKNKFSGAEIDLVQGTPPRGLKVEELMLKTAVRGAVIDDTGLDQGFEIEIYNNLDNDAAQNTPRVVPPDSALLVVTGHSQGFQNRCEVLLKGAPIYDSSMTANVDVNLTGNKNLQVVSVDPLRNWIRANRDIVLGHFVEGATTENVTMSTLANAPPSVLWAKGDIKHSLTPVSGGGTYEALSGAKLEQARQKINSGANGIPLPAGYNANGSLATRSSLNNNIYKLKVSDLVVPYQESQLEAGSYYVSSAPVSWTVNGQEYTVPLRSLSIYREGQPPEIHYDHSAFIAANLPAAGPDGLPEGFEFPNSAGAVMVPHDDGVVRLGSGPAPADWPAFGPHAMIYAFANNGFQTNPKTMVKVDGDLNIFSNVVDQAPVVALTGDQDGQSDGSGAIRTTGSLGIMGTVAGRGSLIAESGDLNIMATAAVDSDWTDPENKVILYGKNVSIWGGDKPVVAFNGLAYAQENLSIHGGVQLTVNPDRTLSFAPSAQKLKTVWINGAAVAATGSLKIDSCDNVTALYNDYYLKKFTKGLPQNHKRLEQMWWRSPD